MSDEDPIKWGDQFAHAALGFFLSLPILGGLFGVIAREYYQRKRTMEAVMGREPRFDEVLDIEPDIGGEGFDFFKRDLIASYIGIGLCIIGMIVVFWKWVI